MRSEVMPTVMRELESREFGHQFSGQYKTKDIRALVNKVKELEVRLALETTAPIPVNAVDEARAEVMLRTRELFNYGLVLPVYLDQAVLRLYAVEHMHGLTSSN